MKRKMSEQKRLKRRDFNWKGFERAKIIRKSGKKKFAINGIKVKKPAIFNFLNNLFKIVEMFKN